MKNEPKVNLLEALKAVVDAKNMDDSVVLNALKQALISAAKKYLHVDKKIDVEITEDEVHVFLRAKVVDDYPDYDPSMTAEEVEKLDEEYMLVPEAQEFDEDAQPGDLLEMEVPTTTFGRQAIQTAKQLLTQQIRDAERQKILDTYKGRIGTMISGEVLRLEGRNVIVSLGKQTEAVIPPREQISHERLGQGQSVKAVIARVEESSKNGAQVVLSRASGDFLKEALLHVPADKPFRGPEEYSNGDYTYKCSIEGDYEWFLGQEMITFRGEQIYECCFHGGLIK